MVHIQLTVAVTVHSPKEGDSEESHEELVARVMQVFIPHPDSLLYTGEGDEHITVLVTEATAR